MTYCVRILLFALGSYIWAMQGTLSHRITAHDDFQTITIYSNKPAHINPDGLIIDQKIINPKRKLPLPHHINLRKKNTPQSINVYACLDTGQCIKPYTTIAPSNSPKITSSMINGALAAIGNVFNPCFAPMWLIVSSQTTLPIILSSCIMGVLLSLYQLSLQYFGISVLTALHQYGLHELGLIILASLAFTMLFPEKFQLPQIITRRSSQLPGFLAIIVSAGCLMPIQLGSIVALQLTQSLTWLFAGTFLTTSIFALGTMAALSRKAYATCLKFFPPLFQLIGLAFIIYIAFYQLQSSWGLALLLLINLYIFCRGQGWLHYSKSIISLTALLIPIYSPLHLAKSDTTEKLIEHALKREGQKLYVSAEWCSQCRLLKSQIKEQVIWLDITTMSPWKEKWVNEHKVDILPSCFVSKNKNWVSCKS